MKLTEAQAMKAVKNLYAFYRPNWGTAEEIQVKTLTYVRDLVRWDVEAEDLSVAILEVRRTSEFMPTLAAIHKALPQRGITTTDLLVEANDIFDHLRRQAAAIPRCPSRCYLSLADLEAAHGRAARNAAAVAGGWDRINDTPDDYVRIVRERFVQAYVNFVEEYHGEHRAIRGAPRKEITGTVKNSDEQKLDALIGVDDGSKREKFKSLFSKPQPTREEVEARIAKLKAQALELQQPHE